MIFFDKVHIATDGDTQELHDFAKKVGIKEEWFRELATSLRIPHYFVPRNLIELVLEQSEVIPCTIDLLLVHCDPSPPKVI